MSLNNRTVYSFRKETIYGVYPDPFRKQGLHPIASDASAGNYVCYDVTARNWGCIPRRLIDWRELWSWNIYQYAFYKVWSYKTFEGTLAPNCEDRLYHQELSFYFVEGHKYHEINVIDTETTGKYPGSAGKTSTLAISVITVNMSSSLPGKEWDKDCSKLVSGGMGQTDDGKFTTYLQKEEEYSNYDPKLFCILKCMLQSDPKIRDVKQIELKDAIPRAIFYYEELRMK